MMMPLKSSRRNRYNYSTVIEKSTITPIERVSRGVNDDVDTTSLSQSWTTKGTPNNIRRTPSRHERTDYTYADSGVYHSERLNDAWVSPNMARPPIHSSSAFKTPFNVDYSDSEAVRTQMTEGTFDSKFTETRREGDYEDEEDFEDEETSSRSSIASSRSSTRILRSRCKQIAGDWCTHSDCSKVMTNRRMSAIVTIGAQRNTNNTNDLVPPAATITHGPNTRGGGGRRSRRATTIASSSSVTRSSVKTATIDPPVSDAQVEEENTRLSGTRSTYVYTYVPDGLAGSSSRNATYDNGDGPEKHSSFWKDRIGVGNDSRSPESTLVMHRTDTSLDKSSWFSKHIFGFGKSVDERVLTDPHAISSDAEEAEPVINSRASSSRHLTSASRSSTHRFSQQNNRSQHQQPPHQQRRSSDSARSCFTRWLWQCGKLLKHSCLVSLFLVYSCIVTIGSFLGSTMKTAWRVCRDLLFAFDESSSSAGKLAIHPRLTQFDSHSGRSSRSEKTETDFITRSTRTTILGVSRLGSLCCRLVGLLCFLIPLLLLLAFLFAPVALDDDDVASPVWPPYLSDSECHRALLDPVPHSASSVRVAYWRVRCLYQLYFLTQASPDDDIRSVGDASKSTESFWHKWFSHPDKNATFTLPPSGQPETDSERMRLIDQLAAFSQAVNQRLDLLTQALQNTNDRVTTSSREHESRFNIFSTQLTQLQSQLNTQGATFNDWRTQLLVNQTSGASDAASTASGDQYSLHAILEATNQTIINQLTSLRATLETEQLLTSEVHQSNISQLSLMLNHLRQQLIFRLRRTEDELSRIRVRLHSINNGQMQSQDTVTQTVRELQVSGNRLSDRIAHLQQTTTEMETLVATLKEGVKQCQTSQVHQVERCKESAMEASQTAVAALSKRLTALVSEQVKEVLSQQLTDLSSNSAFHVQLNELVTRITHEVLRNYKLAAGSTTSLSVDQASIHGVIDAALQRFAADRTGMADFALESAGGAIVGTRCTRTYTDGAALFSLFGIPLARLSNSPRTILQPGNNPGDCWPFHGSTGQAVIRLSVPIVLSAVSLEHLPRALAPQGRLDSSPREFVIKGLASELDEEGVIVGEFTYDSVGQPIQTFPIKNQSTVWQYIEFAVLSNHGHPLYTCVYRLRIHGEPVMDG